jgi:hypothetical protein
MADEVSKEALERAYKRVEREALERTQQQENPRAILLGGQPGSGESELANQSLRELRQSGGAVTIDADRMREENPRYQQLSKEDPQNAADRTHKEAAEWSMRLTVTAIEQRRNLVVNGTMRSPENMRALATRLKENGYDMEAASWRWIPKPPLPERDFASRNRSAYVAMAASSIKSNTTMPMLEFREARIRWSAKNWWTAFGSTTPNQRQVYENAQDLGEWKKAPEAGQAIEQERAHVDACPASRVRLSAGGHCIAG